MTSTETRAPGEPQAYSDPEEESGRGRTLPEQLGSVCVVGLGYIGLPTASVLARRGYRVVGVDVSDDVRAVLGRGEVHIREPELEDLVRRVVRSGNLCFEPAPAECDVFVISVPTPLTADRKPDLSFVEEAARSIVPVLRPGTLVILESTCPVGTTDGLLARVLAESGLDIGREVHLAYCPERVLPGRILSELVSNDRVVGGIDESSTDRAARFYRTFVDGEVLLANSRTAEMVKLAENSYRDVNLAFANELAGLCERFGIDPWELVRLANHHPRVEILRPGPGVGGHCIPIDPWFLIDSAPEATRLLRAARAVNDSRPAAIVQRVVKACGDLADPVIACLGITFKADVDDVRSSPAIEVLRRLRGALPRARLIVVEPNLESHREFDLQPLDFAVGQSDVVLLLVDHEPFRRLELRALEGKQLVDTRGILR